MTRTATRPARRTRPALVLLALMQALWAAQPLDALQAQDTLPCEEIGRLLFAAATRSGASCVVTMPRPDVRLTLLGATIPPSIALDSRAVFDPLAGQALVFGELALTAGEVQRTLRSLRTAAFDIDAVHAHMAGESPAITYVHYRGKGEARELASLLGQALGRPLPTSPIRNPAIVGDWGRVAGVPCASLASTTGTDPDGVEAGPGYCRLRLPEPVAAPSVQGAPVPTPALRSEVAFVQMQDRTGAVMIARLVARETGLPAALDSLIEAGVAVVALQDDLLGEVPRLGVLHVQARGNPLLLAEAMKAALAASLQDGSSSSSGGPLSRMR